MDGPIYVKHEAVGEGVSSGFSAQPQSEARPLSPAEIRVLKCLAEGSSNKVIAIRYCLSEATVKIHVKNILRKVNAGNRTQAAIWARENGVHFS
ncbi:response regulator transcription factor [Methylobacterium durans]|nr:response regulator transcription factor [Methylobacterium durans]